MAIEQNLCFPIKGRRYGVCMEWTTVIGDFKTQQERMDSRIFHENTFNNEAYGNDINGGSFRAMVNTQFSGKSRI